MAEAIITHSTQQNYPAPGRRGRKQLEIIRFGERCSHPRRFRLHPNPKPASAAISAVIAFVGPSRDGIQPRARVQSAGAGPAGREMGMQRGIWMSGIKETSFPTELGRHWVSQHLSSTISEDGVLPARAAREPSLMHVFGACPGKSARISHSLPHHRF